jgi:aminopeptidase N
MIGIVRQRIRVTVVARLLPLAMLPALASSAVGAVGAEAPFSFDSAPGRLPKDVVPVDYDIAIVPNIAAHSFKGTESVKLQVRSTTSQIIFNTLNLKLHDVRLDGTPVLNVATDNDAQLTTVTLAKPAATGDHTLTISYEGVIEQEPQGLFAQAYEKPGGGKGVMLSTQMETTDARRMFPGWDEPAFRARFTLTATVPANWATIANMPRAKRVVHGNLATVSFDRSPRMPTYLVEFSAGDLRELSADGHGVHLGVWALRGREQDRATALANAQQILADYNDYFDYPFPLPRLDSIAIPGGFSGAMENWGAITYMDVLLLLSKASSIDDRQLVYSTQAHEMAHQWNGDLVTMGWWDDLWLNESFASWRAAKETDLRNPTWKWWEGQDQDKEKAMFADAQSTSHAIQQHIEDEQQAANAFDPVITYSKGQAVLRMFENYMGPDTFRDGIRAYMKAHAYSNATTADLWQALDGASHQDIGSIAAGWTEQAGFPVVQVAAHCDASGHRTVSLSQHRFLLRPASGDDANANANANASAPHWNVPLQVRAGANGPPKSVLFTADGQQEAAGGCDEPLSIDADAIGYFRAEYDAVTLDVNTHRFGSLPDGDRIALLDDQWALVESGAAKLESYLALAGSMGGDLDARAWTQIADALAVVEYDERETPGHDAFATYARSVLRPAVDRLGWDGRPGDSAAQQSLRRLLLRYLGEWGDQKVIDEARVRFARFRQDAAAISPDDQAMILSIVGRYADAATFEQLHQLARQANDAAQKQRLYEALSGVADPKLAEQVPQIALSNELPPQAANLPRDMVSLLRAQHPKLAWDTLASQHQKLLAPLGGAAPLVLAQYIPLIFWNSLSLDQLESWLRANVPATMSASIDRGMQGAKFKVSEKEMLVPAADSYVAAHPHG